MHLVVAGISHRTAPVDLIGKFSVLVEKGTEIARILKQEIGTSESLVLSTCNRFEVYAVVHNARVDFNSATEAMGSLCGVKVGNAEWYLHTDGDAVSHIFSVASGLDAMATGETQVLSQLKMAYQRAWEDGITGPILNRTLHRAFYVAKRVHTESKLSSMPLSLASIAAAHAARLAGEPSRARAVIAGPGEMGVIAARNLVREGFAEVSIAGRTPAHAQAAAAVSGAKAIVWSALSKHIADADVLITAISSKRPVIRSKLISGSQTRRHAGTLNIIDLGVPRNVERSVRLLGGINLVTIDDLKDVIESNSTARNQAANLAGKIVVEESERFTRELNGNRSTQVIARLSKNLDDIRGRELARLFKSLPRLTQKERSLIEAAAKSITAKILHEPARFMRDEALGDEERFASTNVLRRVFRLKE